MFFVTLFLVRQTKAEKRVELGLHAKASFRRENLALVIILFFFCLSYGIRFVFNVYLDDHWLDRGKWFAWYLTIDIISLGEGTSFMAVLLYHSKNF